MAATLLVGALLATACGTRTDRAAIAAAYDGTHGRTTTSSASDTQTASKVPLATGADPALNGAASQATSGASAGGSASGAGPAQAAAGGAAASTAGAGGAAPTGGADILVGNVSSRSTLIGAAVAGVPVGVQVWVQWVNAHGGINGHRVKLVTADDRADPAAHVAAVRKMVESDKVLAFVGNATPVTATAGSSYLAQKQIPVVGGDIVDPIWSTGNPMFFPQGTTPFEGLWGMAVTAVQNGDKRIGLVTCQETSLCRQVDQLINGHGWAGLAGGSLVYSATASIAAPEYTAICQNAVNAGVQALLVIADAATLIRMARSCGSTKMRFYSASLAIQNVLATDNPGALEGLVGIQQIFPFPVTNLPGAQQFREAMATYAPGISIDAGSAQGWVAGKLFELAARKVGSVPTTSAILDGLAGISNETLGGLTVPLTFSRGKPAPEAQCWFIAEVHGKSFTAPRGATPICSRHP